MNDAQSETVAEFTEEDEMFGANTEDGDDEDVTISPRHIEADGGDSSQNVSAFQSMYSIDIGRVLVTDNETGETLTQWKAKASTGEEHVSADQFDAIMGLIEQLSGGL
jgi:hypothetical protein